MKRRLTLVVLLLAAILVTLLDSWPLVATLALVGAAVAVPIGLLAAPVLLVRRFYVRRDYIRRLHAFLAGQGPIPPEGLP